MCCLPENPAKEITTLTDNQTLIYLVEHSPTDKRMIEPILQLKYYILETIQSVIFVK